MKPIKLPADPTNPVYRKKIEALVWKYSHPDFKSKRADGTKVVNHNEHDGRGTMSVSLASLTVEALYRKLPNAVKDAIFAGDTEDGILPMRWLEGGKR